LENKRRPLHSTKYPGIKKFVFIMIACVWMLALILILEVGAQLKFKNRKQLPSQYSANLQVRRVSEAFHADLWKTPWREYKPNSSAKYSAEGITYEANINSIGFRGKEIPKTEGNSYIIACIGGSTTVKGGSDSTTYPALLQEILNKENPKKYTVINGGVSGRISNEYGSTIETLLDQVHPDIVIEYNAVNDICWRLFHHWRKQLNLVERLLLKSQFIKYFFGDYFLPDERTIRRDIDRITMENLRSIASRLGQHGIQFSVSSFLYPSPDTISKDQYAYLDHNLRYWWKSDYISYRKYCYIVDIYNKMLKETFEETEAWFIPLAETGDYPFDFFTDVTHMNSRGIRVKANNMANLIRHRLK